MTDNSAHAGFGVVPDSFATDFPFASREERFAAGPDHAWLYRYYDADGCLLYVGLSKHPAIRDEQHWLSRKVWRRSATALRMDLFGKRGLASRAEGLAIHTENPIGNSQRFPPDWSDRNVTRAPDGIRTIWAAVCDYSDEWKAPVVGPSPTYCFLASGTANVEPIQQRNSVQPR